MKQILFRCILIFMALCFLSSCKKDHESIGDYLPLKVGAKYLYFYEGFMSFNSSQEASSKHGECQWEFIDMTLDTPHVYNVRQTFNGIHVICKEDIHSNSYEYCDTIVITNEISTLTFQENEDGKVKIKIPIMYSWSSVMTIERFFEYPKIDTCFSESYQNICLSKNIGIKSFEYNCRCNSMAAATYTLLNGPY